MAEPAIIVHGGAGALPESEDESRSALDGVRRAAGAALELMRAGGSALAAVELAVRILEDDPRFNAALGAAMDAEGGIELDASMMDGATLRGGGAGAVRDVRNPVLLARLVMERTPHVLLVGPGASAFARGAGIPACTQEELITPRQRARWEAARGGVDTTVATPDGGTVGAAARDGDGHLAAATSTGGLSLKLPGRVGDSAIIGCGTYADDRLAAVSCTGDGDRIIEVGLARRAAELVGTGMSPTEAVVEAMRVLDARPEGRGGLILVAPEGEPVFAFDSPAMARAWSTAAGQIVSAI